MVLFYSAAARKEERKFESSPLASEYEAYRQRTGRFIPKLRSQKDA
jgi:protein-S-isoprenylcysteine O-methyltransferase Ste14